MNDDLAFDVPASVFAEPDGDTRYTDPGDYRAQDDEDREKRVAVIGPTFPIAAELLQAERERLFRAHYESPLLVNTCPGCARLRDIVAELREIGASIG